MPIVKASGVVKRRLEMLVIELEVGFSLLFMSSKSLLSKNSAPKADIKRGNVVVSAEKNVCRRSEGVKDKRGTKISHHWRLLSHISSCRMFDHHPHRLPLQMSHSFPNCPSVVWSAVGCGYPVSGC